MARLGLDYQAVKCLNPRLVYAGISGYGESGPWVEFPGQDLLAQSLSGVLWLNGDVENGPVPFGLAVADMLSGHLLTEGILAALVRRGITGDGAQVQTSLLEALIDFQFEVLTTYLNDGGRAPERSGFRNAHAYLAAPYGVYPTQDGYLALAMMPLAKLAKTLPLPALDFYVQMPGSEFSQRDAIKRLIAAHLLTQPVSYWLNRLQPEDVWCAEVLEWDRLLKHEAFRQLDILHNVSRDDGIRLRTTRSPIRINGHRVGGGHLAAPRIGEHTETLRREFNL